ncbi:MAG: hypothetical protein ACYDEE_00200 [Ignavibacteriaceae bacterium]
MNQGGFCWRRFVGISGAKAKISRRIGIPLSKSGRYMKVGRIVTRGGCLVVLLIPIMIIWAVVKKFIFKEK